MNERVSIVKAIAIILMVVGHAGCPAILQDIIYYFHMPLFFIFSGFFFKEKYLKTPITYAKNKFKGIYLPFVKWGLLFLIFHNLLANINVYDTSYSMIEYVKMVVKTILMIGKEPLLGGYWFLHVLLIASLICYIIIYSCNRISRQTDRQTLAVYIIAAIVLLFLSMIDIKIQSYYTNRIFLACFMFLSGYIFSFIVNNFNWNNWFIVLTGYAICCSASLFMPPMSMWVKGLSVVPYAVLAICGTLATYSLASIIDKQQSAVRNWLVKVGNLTLYILTFHFLSFKIISYIMIKYAGYTEPLSSYPVIKAPGCIWWITYSIIGVIAPLSMYQIGNSLSHKIKLIINK